MAEDALSHLLCNLLFWLVFVHECAEVIVSQKSNLLQCRFANEHNFHETGENYTISFE